MGKVSLWLCMVLFIGLGTTSAFAADPQVKEVTIEATEVETQVLGPGEGGAVEVLGSPEHGSLVPKTLDMTSKIVASVAELP